MEISITKKVMSRLRAEGKVHPVNFTKNMEATAKYFESVRREFLLKQYKSELSASTVFFTA